MLPLLPIFVILSVSQRFRQRDSGGGRAFAKNYSCNLAVWMSCLYLCVGIIPEKPGLDDLTEGFVWSWSRAKSEIEVASKPTPEWSTLIGRDYWGLALIGFHIFIVLLRQLSSAIKNQLVASKVWALLLAGSLWHKGKVASIHGKVLL